MGITAADIMTTSFATLRPEMPISQAVALFKRSSRERGRQVFGLVVTDEQERIVGMLSMYDILLLLRPKHISVWGGMGGLDIEGLIEQACQQTSQVLVGDIMSTEVITLPPEAHAFVILDLMLRKHIRRIPVVGEGRMLGMVYISDLFERLASRMMAS